MLNFFALFGEVVTQYGTRILDLYNLTSTPYKFIEEFDSAHAAAEYDVLMLDKAKSMGLVSEAEHTALVNHVRGY